MQMQDDLNKFSKIIDIDDILVNSIFYLKYKNKYLEEKYNQFLLQSSKKMRILVNFISLCLLTLRFIDSCKGNRFGIDFYMDILTCAIALVLFIFLHYVAKSFKVVKIFSSIYTVFVCFFYAYSSVIYRFILPQDDKAEYQIQNKFVMIIITIFEFLFFLEYDFFVALMLHIINVAAAALSLALSINQTVYGYRGLFTALFIVLLVIYMKRMHSVLQRQHFLQKYKIDKYLFYCHDLINNMNGLQFTMKNGKVVFYNQVFKRYLIDSKIADECVDHNFNCDKDVKEVINFGFEMQKDYGNEFNKIEKEKEKEKKGIFCDEKYFIKSFNLKNAKHLNINNLINIKDIKEEKVFINANTKNLNNCQDNYENIENYFKNKLKIKSDLKNENENKEKNENENKEKNEVITLKIPEEHSNEASIKNKNTETNLNILLRAKKSPLALLEENEKFRDLLIESYLESIKPIKIEKEFEFLNINLEKENLLRIFEKIRHSEIDQNHSQSQKPNATSFSFLGDFFMQKDNKHFQVYFRKH